MSRHSSQPGSELGDGSGESRAGTSWASSLAVRHTMQANRSRDTGPERERRSALHGLRFRKHMALLPHGRGRADVVFAKARVAVFVDGCFWHGCPEHRTIPKTHPGPLFLR